MGILIAAVILIVWGSHLFYSLTYVDVSLSNPFMYLHMLLQGYFYTGLFITGHDAMHMTIARSNKVNRFFGYLSCFLFAGMSYKRLVKNHFMHHKHPGEEKDPDFNTKSQNFFIWWGTFLVRYTTISQLIVMGVLYNVLKLQFSEPAIWAFWVIPAFLGTFQLFYFGTYLPHMRPHEEEMKPHNARSLKKNHLLAMLTCYFFGYHYEHHESPRTPWWQLYKLRQ